MSRFCPYCGTDAGSGFARCPNCGFDMTTPAGQGGQAQDGTTVVAPPGSGEWGKTVVEPTAPRHDAGRRARFDREREFYESVDETHTETAVPGETIAGDQTVIERQRQDAPDDATVIVRGGRKGVTGPLAYLVECSGVRAGKVHLLRTETSIGRGPDNDVTLGDDSVSRRHAKIRLEEGTFVFWDLASANYSYLVGADGSRTRILEPRRLVDGDKLDLGDARVTFLLVDGGETSDAS
ncbi:MAG: FHA domain-containing protein [Candidatus Limnocylindrales bacterium]